MAQISAAWILAKPGVTAPIVGTTSLKNLEEILGASPFPPVSEHLDACALNEDSNACVLADALDIKLTADEMKYLEEPYKPLNVLGHA